MRLKGADVMFGYVVVNKPEMKIKDHDTYTAFYCGLCQTLKKRFGRFSQLALNYDMTFLALLLSGLYEPKTEQRTYRCPLHPTQKRIIMGNAYLEYAADMTVLLTYLKCEDNWLDERSKSSRLYQRLLKKQYERVVQQYPAKCERIIAALKQGTELEEQGCLDLDRLSALSGAFLAEVCCYKEDEWSSYLRRMGDYLGRFIYVLDAYDDIEKDQEKGLFNPLKEKGKQSDFEDWIYKVLELLIAESADAFEMLPILEYEDILRNILYSGVWSKYSMIRKKRAGEYDGRSI